MYMYLRANNLTGEEVDEVQTLTFTPEQITIDNDGGWFALEIDGNVTPDIWFNEDDPGAMENDLQGAIDGLGYPGVTVDYQGGYDFEVTFGGGSSGQDVPPIQMAVPQYLPIEGEPDLTYVGNIGSTEDVKGGIPEAAEPDVYAMAAGYEGTRQARPTIGMEPDGDFAVAWTQFDEYTTTMLASNNIYARTFNEQTDTAGPLVTDFILPDGRRLIDGGQVSEELTHIGISFDEDMMEEGIHSVTDPRNWALLRDGIEVNGGIRSITYSMNRIARYADATGGPDQQGRNKWEAVIIFDGDGTSGGVNPTPLGDGHYELVALNSLRDKAVNPLGRTGFNINGVISLR